MASLLNSMSATIRLEGEPEPELHKIQFDATTSELENIRHLQGKINEILTAKIALLKTETENSSMSSDADDDDDDQSEVEVDS